MSICMNTFISSVRAAAVALLGLVLVTLTPAAGAAVTDGQRFQDWTVRCDKPAEGAPEGAIPICYLHQQVKGQQGDQPLMFIMIGYLPNKSEPVAILSFPLGIFLPTGITLQIDDGKPARFPIERCFPNGCRAGLELADELLNAFKSGTGASFTYHYDSEQKVTARVSLSGFTAGVGALK
jgi:invasion protein IalB